MIVSVWDNVGGASGVTESLFGGGGGGGQRGEQTFIWGGGEDGIAMKGAQSKVKCGGGGQWRGQWVNGGPSHPSPPPPRSYATGKCTCTCGISANMLIIDIFSF